MSQIEFVSFPKIPRLFREIVVTEKLDGTNGQIWFSEDMSEFLVGSRNRWITPEDDNYGFAKWVHQNLEDLKQLGPGHHFGEWWGKGIQKGYNVPNKRFSLFNTSRWDSPDRPYNCLVVPTLYKGMFSEEAIRSCLHKLEVDGSVAAPGSKAEGIIVYHVAANKYFKYTIGSDGHKG